MASLGIVLAHDIAPKPFICYDSLVGEECTFNFLLSEALSFVGLGVRGGGEGVIVLATCALPGLPRKSLLIGDMNDDSASSFKKMSALTDLVGFYKK